MSDPPSVRTTLVRNTTFNAAGRLWEAVANVVLTAYIVPRVGVAAWGLWAVVSMVTSYATLLDFGVGSGFAKYIAEHAARRERDAVSSVVSTGFFFYLVLGIAIVAIGWPCIDSLIALFSRLKPGQAATLSGAEFIGDVRFLLRWGLVLFAASNCMAAFTAIQTGLQRMGVTNALSLGASIIKILATVAFIETGHGIRGLLYANAVVFACFAGAGVVAAYVLFPGLRVSPRAVTMAAMERLFSFGWQTQVSKLANLVLFQTDKAVVGLVYKQFGLIGVYRIGEELASKMRQVPVLLLSAIIPAASDLDARGDQDRLRRLYLLSSKYVSAVTLPLVAFCVGASGPLVRTWMGSGVEGLDMAAWVNRIIAFGYLANIIPGAGVSIALGMGRPDVQMKAGIIAAVTNVAFTVALVFTIGFYGIAIGTAISMIISCVWFMAAMRPLVDVGIGQLVRVSMLWPAVASLPGFLACTAADWFSADTAGRLPNAGVLLVSAAVFTSAYLLIIRFTPFLDAFDVEFLANVLKLKHVPGFHAYTRRVCRG